MAAALSSMIACHTALRCLVPWRGLLVSRHMGQTVDLWDDSTGLAASTCHRQLASAVQGERRGSGSKVVVGVKRRVFSRFRSKLVTKPLAGNGAPAGRACRVSSEPPALTAKVPHAAVSGRWCSSSFRMARGISSDARCRWLVGSTLHFCSDCFHDRREQKGVPVSQLKRQAGKGNGSEFVVGRKEMIS